MPMLDVWSRVVTAAFGRSVPPVTLFVFMLFVFCAVVVVG